MGKLHWSKILKTNILIASLEILFVVNCLLWVLDENYDIYYTFKEGASGYVSITRAQN